MIDFGVAAVIAPLFFWVFVCVPGEEAEQLLPLPSMRSVTGASVSVRTVNRTLPVLGMRQCNSPFGSVYDDSANEAFQFRVTY